MTRVGLEGLTDRLWGVATSRDPQIVVLRAILPGTNITVSKAEVYVETAGNVETARLAMGDMAFAVQDVADRAYYAIHCLERLGNWGWILPGGSCLFELDFKVASFGSIYKVPVHWRSGIL